MKQLILAVLMLASTQAFATELTTGTLVGRYKVEARVFLQSFYGNFRVVNARDFEFQRTYPDGKADEVCTGSYTLVPSFYLVTDTLLAPSKTFQGTATCPSDRQKKLDLAINFENTTVEDLVRGTTVKVKTSLAGGLRINAYVKKQ